MSPSQTLVDNFKTPTAIGAAGLSAITTLAATPGIALTLGKTFEFVTNPKTASAYGEFLTSMPGPLVTVGLLAVAATSALGAYKLSR